MLRTAAADLIQLASDDDDLVPIARLGGRLLAPDRSYLATQLDLLQRLTAADPGAVLVRLAGQMFTGYDAADPGVPAIAAMPMASASSIAGTPGPSSARRGPPTTSRACSTASLDFSTSSSAACRGSSRSWRAGTRESAYRPARFCGDLRRRRRGAGRWHDAAGARRANRRARGRAHRRFR
jgi:hypothetical protein